MAESVDLKSVVADILSSYEARMTSLDAIFDATPLMFGESQESLLDKRAETEKLNAQLRDILAKNEHLRRKDFDNMMQGILSAQEERERQVKNLLKRYFQEQKSVAGALRKGLEEFRDCLTRGETQRVKEFREATAEIFARQNERKEEITTKLSEFQRQQQETSRRLKELLAKGKELRIRDLKLMLKEFKGAREKGREVQKKRKEEVVQMLTGYSKQRQKSNNKN